MVQVQRALVPSLGGDPATTLDEVVARLARAKVGSTHSQLSSVHFAAIRKHACTVSLTALG